MAKKRHPVSEAGEKYRYSNLAYFLLGTVIETTSHQDYSDFLRHRVLLPLKMSSTR